MPLYLLPLYLFCSFIQFFVDLRIFVVIFFKEKKSPAAYVHETKDRIKCLSWPTLRRRSVVPYLEGMAG